MDKTYELVGAIYEVTTVQNKLYAIILEVGLSISFITVVLLVISNARIRRAAHLIRSTTWITPNESMEAFDNLDYDSTPVEIEWHTSKWSPPEWAILHSVDTEHGDNELPTKSKVYILCTCDFKRAMSDIDNLDSSMSISVLIISMGNTLAAALGIAVYYVKYDAALVAALAANSFLVAGPIGLSLFYIIVIQKLKRRHALHMVDINDACKKSSTGHPQQTTPIWSRCWIITRHYEGIGIQWKNVCDVMNSDDWNPSNKQSLYEKIMCSTIRRCNDTFKAINMDTIRTSLEKTEYINKIDIAVAETYSKRERNVHMFVENRGITSEFIRGCQLGNKWLDIEFPSTDLHECLDFAAIGLLSSEQAVNNICAKSRGIIEANKIYYLIIGVFGQLHLPAR